MAALLGLSAALACGGALAQEAIYRCGNVYSNQVPSAVDAARCSRLDEGLVTVIPGTRAHPGAAQVEGGAAGAAGTPNPPASASAGGGARAPQAGRAEAPRERRAATAAAQAAPSPSLAQRQAQTRRILLAERERIQQQLDRLLAPAAPPLSTAALTEQATQAVRLREALASIERELARLPAATGPSPEIP